MAANIRTILFTIFCVFFAFLPGHTVTAESTNPNLPLEILNITPDGEDVPAGNKIVFQFNRPVVPIGAMDRKASEIPIIIRPKLNGHWRWLNTSTLAYILDQNSALKPATKYEVQVNPGIKAEDGATLSEPVNHTFITQRPRVVHSWFRTWRSPTVPVIRITFNQPVSKGSVEKHIYMETSLNGLKRTPLKAEPDDKDQETPVFLPLPGENIALINISEKKEPAPSSEDSGLRKFFKSITGIFSGSSQKDNKKGDTSEESDREARRIWLISPEKPLLENASVFLRLEPGLESALGPEKGTGKRELLKFSTFPDFSFKGLVCYRNNGKRLYIDPDEAKNNVRLCNPGRSVSLLFSSPVLSSELGKNIKLDPPLPGTGTEDDPWENMRDYSQLNSIPPRYGEYYKYLPRTIEANQLYRINIDHNLRDEFGRELNRDLDISFQTDHRTPNFDLTHPVSILEKDIDTDMPVVVTNIDRMTLSYSTLTSKGKEIKQDHELSLPKTRDVPLRIAMDIRDMLGGESGVVTGTVDSEPFIRKYGDGKFFFGEVTPFQVHVKLGHFNTLVWVTDLKTGQPVKDAKVSIYLDTYRLSEKTPEVLTQGITDSDGVVSLAGSQKLDPENKHIYVYNKTASMFFTRVEKGNDMALLPMDYNFLMNTFSASNNAIFSYKRKKYDYIRAWGTTAQGVYRAGDEIQYKIYVRNQDNEKFVPAPKGKYFLKVKDPMNKTVYEVNDIELSEFGAIQGEFTVPKTGAVGRYDFMLTSSFTKQSWHPMSVLVSDFTPSPFKVTTDINAKDYQPGDKLEITTQARLHGGGPYTDASARVSVILRGRRFSSDDPLARGFFFNSYTPESEEIQTLLQKADNIDDKGNLVTSSTLPESSIYFGRLDIESAVRDDRGKYIAGRATANYASRDRFVGLRCEHWLLKQGQESAVDVITVDAKGKPVKGVSVSIRAERKETTAARVKGAGNAYLTRLNTEWVKEKKEELKSGPESVSFKFTPKKSGLYRITASIKDTRGREHSTEITKWVAGKGMVLWEDDNKNGLDIIPEKTDYRVGETARYLVKNPYPGAKCLITVERYGVIKQWVQTLDTATPVVEFEIEKDFIPGYYLSIVVVSPRVEKPPADNSVDLGKPAFRMGYVQTMVTDSFKKIHVEIKPGKDTYKPGDKARVKLHTTYSDGSEPVELAVAVLDEAVLDLLSGGSSNFDPYSGFYKIENLDMLNYSLLMQLVGRQKFEKKGADPAGDGGGDIGIRNLFKFVSYWNPSIKADSKGNAEIEFKIPDNLTGWRVLAMAVTPGEKMGLGEGRFNVNRPTEIRPVMPNQVTEGDSFVAGFSVMNRTDRERSVNITINAKGTIEADDGQQKTDQTVDLKPFKRTTVWMPVKTKGSGKIYFTAAGGDAIDKDGTVYELEVRKMASLETAATYGSTEAAEIRETVIFPDNIRTDVGKVFINLSPTVIGNLEGAFKYLRDYTYSCWEQKITRAVMASHYLELKKYMPQDFIWEDAEEIPGRMLELASAYQAPSGGMTYYYPDERFVSPYLSAYTAIAFNRLRAQGYDIPTSVENRLHGYLETFLRIHVAPSFYSKGMASTVRAVALAALAENHKISIDDLKRYFPHVKEMDTFGKAHFLIAASLVDGADEMAKDVFKMIISQADQTGGKFIINDTFDDGYSRILTSTIRTNAAVLSALLAYGKTEEGKRLTKDMPFKMVRYITQTRKQSGRWENTQENVFCMNALTTYSGIYESVKPDMAITGYIGKDELGKAEFRAMTDDPVALKRLIEKGDPGRHTQATIKKEGSGRYYYSVGMSYAPEELRKETINAGIEVKREYSVERDGKWILLKSPMKIKRGELVRVDLYVSIPSARNFVVVDDSVPGGLEPVNRDLATASTVDADKAKSNYAKDSWFFHYGEWSYYGMSRWSFYHKELRHHAAIFYSEYLSAGNYHLSYTAQAIASGEFTVMPTHAEEMYDPDVFGKSAPAMLNVEK